jgi:hypothetical protein
VAVQEALGGNSVGELDGKVARHLQAHHFSSAQPEGASPRPDVTVKFWRNERAPHGVRLGLSHTRTPDERR